MKSLLVNDITLRDGEQAPGVNFFPEEKLRIAEQLVRLGVPIIEAGFPVASEDDVKGVRLVAEAFGDETTVCAMCRAHQKDIQVAAEALRGAAKGRIQVVMGTSDIHLKHKFGMSRSEALDLSAKMVAYAKTFIQDVEFAAEDSTRSDLNYLMDVCQACVRAGAKTIELPDTVGYATPVDYFEMVSAVVNCLPPEIVVSTHCHDDLGLAVANTLAGVQAGAGQVEVTVNGIGERVGNAATEEVIMALKMREDIYHCDLGPIRTPEIVRTSSLVEELSKMTIAYNKAVVGRNAFLHESGIHQDGMIKSPQTYQIMNPQDVGRQGYQFLMGKLSGKHALEQRLRTLHLCDSEATIQEFSRYFKDHAAKKKFITDDDIVGLFERFSTG
ncbi:MAG: 2-isopropylmalate synthase [Planctomycetes bacterium]|nr:2-isopropylmalate synthase [Planctomycetota bacterium]